MTDSNGFMTFLRGKVLKRIAFPLIMFLVVYSAFLFLNLLPDLFKDLFGDNWDTIRIIANNSLKFFQILLLLWISWISLKILHENLQTKVTTSQNKTLQILYPILSNCFRIGIILILANILVPLFALTQLPIFNKSSTILLIFILWYGLYQLINISANIIIEQYGKESASPLNIRKIKTQVLILKRIILTIAAIIFIASILLVFDSVRKIGAGLLTTAGLLSAMGAFASQKSLSRIFSGLHIAFTQPIRIGDTVIIDNELGEVEEISLSYVIIKTWDLRRLILPTDYITTKVLQNLTRNSTQLIGTVMLYVDYTLPIDPLRKAFKQFLSESPYWDKHSSNLQVIEMKESWMELKLTMSAANVDNMSAIRAEIREKLIHFIVEEYPQCLPKVRTQQHNINPCYP